MNQTLPLNAIITNLIESLKVEKSILLDGMYDKLPHVSKKKDAYLSALDQQLSNPAMRHELAQQMNKISLIKKQAQENEKLLLSAKLGVTAAQARLTKISDHEASVGTYLEGGAKLRTHNSGVTREKVT